MVRSKRVGNIIYSFDGSEFSILLVDSDDGTRGVNLYSQLAGPTKLSISNVEFTQSLLEEAHAVMEELAGQAP